MNIEDLLGRKLLELEKKYAPDRIFYRGDLSLVLHSPKIAVIGTRNPSGNGINETVKITKKLISMNAIVVSGLAKGIDTISHKTTIANNGKTIAVLGTPLNKTYPYENTLLQQSIMKHYLAISQFPENIATTPKDFAIRNKLIALISDAVIVVESSENSGTRHVIQEMIRLKKPSYLCRLANFKPLFSKMKNSDFIKSYEQLFEKHGISSGVTRLEMF